MRSKHTIYSALSLLAILCACSVAQDSAPLIPHVSRVVPVLSGSRALSAERPAFAGDLRAPQLRNSAATGNNWQLLATLPGTVVIHDLAFVTSTIGYAAAELGQVWKTTDGGKTWKAVLNLGAPYYFYGVAALTGRVIAVTGFIDSPTTQVGVLRWSHDGGTTWSNDILLASSGTMLQRIRFANSKDAVMLDIGTATAQYTTDGGATALDWTSVVDNPDGGWFGLQFSLLADLHARASGINFCTSLDGGAQWSCGPSVDTVFDGPVFFLGDWLGWVGGGEIYPNVEGWVHVTTDGGKKWSARTLDGPWPIRQIVFLNSKTGWAAGGNVYTGVGGIYFTSDGGQTWSVDADTSAEMDACDKKPLAVGHQVWCAGYDHALNGVIYSAVIP